MRYFRLQLDRRKEADITIKGLPLKKGGEDALRSGDLSNLDDLTVVSAHSHKGKEYPELLDKPLFMFRVAIKEVFDFYMPELKYKSFCLLDDYNKAQIYYDSPILLSVNVISEKSERAQPLKHSIRLKREALEDIDGLDIFLLDGHKDYLMVSLPVAESLLRRNIQGILLTHIPIV